MWIGSVECAPQNEMQKCRSVAKRDEKNHLTLNEVAVRCAARFERNEASSLKIQH